MAADRLREGVIQVAVSLANPEQLINPEIFHADAVEIRLDLMQTLTVQQVDSLSSSFAGPVILTLRSVDEGGLFAGDSSRWKDLITPFLHLVSIVDVEFRYQQHASWLKELGLTVIASCHKNEMLSFEGLQELYLQLRSFGDIPKIAVHPSDTRDLLTLLQFTHNAPKPIIVSVTGTVCRFARPLLPLFGSLYSYCYVDSPTSPGQYSLQEMRKLSSLLAPGILDTCFGSTLNLTEDSSPGMHPHGNTMPDKNSFNT